MSRTCKLALSSALAVAFIATTTDVDAALIDRTLYFNASAHCQAALPVFDGLIRKRPLAVVNEGQASAYVTCGIPSQGGLTSLQVFASSHDGTARTLACTAVSGLEGVSAYYAPRQVELPADRSRASLVWWGTNFGGGLSAPAGEPNFFVGPYLAVTCQLPPATGLNNFILTYREEIGA